MMPHKVLVGFTFARATVFMFVITIPAFGGKAYAQGDTVPNSLPNPYRTIENWAKLPEGRPWGSTAGVSVDRQGNIWVAERCGANTCAGSSLAPILEFDPSGKLLRSFGAGMVRTRSISRLQWRSLRMATFLSRMDMAGTATTAS